MIIEGLLVAIVVGFGLPFLAVGVFLPLSMARHLWERWGAFVQALASRHWVATTGTITRSVVTYTTSRRSRTWTPVVRYTYRVGGEEFVSDRFAFLVPEGAGTEIEAAVRAMVERFRAGTDAEVFYDPEKPKRATLDRTVPPVIASTIGSLLVALIGGGLPLFLGVTIVKGPFEDPPNLGELPSLAAQAGGLAVAVGTLLLLVAGARSLSKEERRQKRLLRRLASAKPALVHELRAGEPVFVSGRAEAPESRDDDAVALPFEDKPLVYYDVDVGWFRRTCFGTFGVQDSSGLVLVEIEETESTLLERRELPLEGEVERWLDEQRDDPSDPISADSRSLTLERIREGDSVLVVGSAEREDGELVFRARPGDPTSLIVGEGSHEAVLGRARKRLGRTRAFLVIGSVLVVTGGIALFF